MRFSSALTKVSVGLFLLLLPALLGAQDATPSSNAVPPALVSTLNLYLKVQLDGKVKFSALRAGDRVEGALSQSVYSRDRELFPAGSRIRFTVDKFERRRREPNDHWPWMIKAFTPRHERYPVFRSATVLRENGEDVQLQVSLISIGHEAEKQASLKQASSKKDKTGSHPESSTTTGADAAATAPRPGREPNRQPTGITANFEAALVQAEDGETPPEDTSGPSSTSSATSSAQPLIIAAGARAKVILLQGVSASKNHRGDSFQARLIEPVFSGATVMLPEGTVFEGSIVKTKAPRMLSRAGSLLLSFTSVASPGRTSGPVAASVTAIQIDRRSHTRVDSEGQLKGERPGKAWLALNMGVSGGLAKVSDDGAQLVIEAVISTATDVSTAGSGRIAGLCASTLFMLTRHGRDVVLPKFTEITIAFDRPVSISSGQPTVAVQ